METEKIDQQLIENTGQIVIDMLCKNSINLVKYSRSLDAKHVNQIQAMTYYALGRRMMEEPQNGSHRTEYGTRVIERLSGALKHKGRNLAGDFPMKI